MFSALWLGQFLSVLATDVEKFGLRVWTYERTGSVSQFALITLFSEAPGTLELVAMQYRRQWGKARLTLHRSPSSFAACRVPG